MAYTKTGTISFHDWYNLKDGGRYNYNNYVINIDEYSGNGGVYGLVRPVSQQILGSWFKIESVVEIKSTDGTFHMYLNKDGTLSQTTTNSYETDRVVPTEDFSYDFVSNNITGYQMVVRNLTIPLFKKEDTDAINTYIESGDDSGAINFGDLHGYKCNIYCTNNGERITFTTKPQDGEVAQYDRIVLYYKINLNEYSVNLPVTNSSYSMTWKSWGLPILKIEAKIVIYSGEKERATFNFTLTRKVLLLGKTAVEPNYIEDNGYIFNGTSDNSFDDIEEEAQEESDAQGNDNDGSGIGGFNNLTQTYQVSKIALDDLGAFIWNNSIFDNIKNLNNSPLENIVSCHYIPCSIGGTNTAIKLGNITTNVSGDRVSQTVKRVNVATFTMPVYNNGFLNYEPYTEVTLYLPLVGMVNLSAKDTIGYTISIDYVFDVVVGSFGVMVYTSKGGGKTLIFSSQGTCSIDIPLTASNKAQVQGAIMQSGVNLIGSAISKDVGGVMSDTLNIANIQHHSTTFGSPSSMVGLMSPKTCYYVIRTSIPYIPNQFAHTHGYMCMSTYKLKDLKGFTKLSNVDLSNFNATEREKEEIYNILTTGFYL